MSDLLSISFPAHASRCDTSFALGKWRIWCVVDSRWYTGQHAELALANAQLFENIAADKHLGKIKQENARHKPDAQTRKTNVVTPPDKLSDLF